MPLLLSRQCSRLNLGVRFGDEVTIDPQLRMFPQMAASWPLPEIIGLRSQERQEKKTLVSLCGLHLLTW